MNAIQNRVAKLESIHGKAGEWDAVVQTLTDDDLSLCIEFLRHQMAELPPTGAPKLDPSKLTGADLLAIMAQARAWGNQNSVTNPCQQSES